MGIEVAQPTPATARRALVGGCIGNAVEWYDFAVYGAFAVVLADLFFPPGNQSARLAATFAIFATSFVARPIGAVMLGRRADRSGRRSTFSLMIAVMSLATACIGLLPTWSAAGAFAPIALLLLRLGQGFAAGGEVPSSVAFLLESAPAGRRGRFGGWHTASIGIGLIGGYGMAALLTSALSRPALDAWGWRLAFLIALPLGLIGRYIRRRVAEPAIWEATRGRPAERLVRALSGLGRQVRQGFVAVAALSLSFNVWAVFLPSYLGSNGIQPLGPALGCTVVALVVAAAAAPRLGRLSDQIGRRPLMIAAALGIAVFAVPGFRLATSGSVLALLLSDVVMGVLIGGLVVPAFVAELFPTRVRATGVAATYGLSTALFGGTAPLVAAILAGAGARWVIPFYVAAIAVLALFAAWRADETAFGEFV